MLQVLKRLPQAVSEEPDLEELALMLYIHVTSAETVAGFGVKPKSNFSTPWAAMHPGPLISGAGP